MLEDEVYITEPDIPAQRTIAEYRRSRSPYPRASQAPWWRRIFRYRR